MSRTTPAASGAPHRRGGTPPAVRGALREFLAFARIGRIGELGSLSVAHGAALAWQRKLHASGGPPDAVRRRVAAVTAHFSRLTPHRRFRSALPEAEAFGPEAARALLDAPPRGTLRGLRDRAILALGIEGGLRAGRIVRLRVRDAPDGAAALPRPAIAGGKEALSRRIAEYVAAAGHGADLDGPLFRPVLEGGTLPPRPISAATVNDVLRRYVRQLGLAGTYSAQSMRLTFIAAAFSAGASAEEVRRAVGRARSTDLSSRSLS